MLNIELANSTKGEKVISFFKKYLDVNNDALVSEEFLCPYGVKAAIQRRQLMVALMNDRVVGAIRFYPRKTDKIVSIYQFAIAPDSRQKT